MKCDLNRVYIDADTFEEIENKPVADELKYSKIRYSIINAGVGFTAKVVHAAIKVKSWAGSGCYAVAGIKMFCGGMTPDSYRLSLFNKIEGEDKLTWSKDVTSMIFAMHNGRFAGGGMPITPGCVMNDGLLDVSYYNAVLTSYTLPGLFNSVLFNCGMHAYQ